MICPVRKKRAPNPAGYRRPMPVADLRIYGNGDSYYLCPRCQASLDRDFVAYCDQCGQHLSWKQGIQARKTWEEQKQVVRSKRS